MDNQQESRTAAALIAGLWLADGTFGMTGCTIRDQRSGSVWRRYYPRLTFVNTDQEVIERAYETLRTHGIGAHIKRYGPYPWTGKWKQRYDLGVYGWKRAEKFLDFVMPHLVGRKLEAAQIVRDCVNIGKGGAGRLTDEERQVRERALTRLRYLNRRGPESSETAMLAPPRWDRGVKVQSTPP